MNNGKESRHFDTQGARNQSVTSFVVRIVHGNFLLVITRRVTVGVKDAPIDLCPLGRVCLFL